MKVVGLQLLQVDTEAVGRAVDVGPSADAPEAGAFRQFWGDRSELRRFQVRATQEASEQLPPPVPIPASAATKSVQS